MKIRLLMFMTLIVLSGQVAEAAGYTTWWEAPDGIHASSVTPKDYSMGGIHKQRAKVSLTSPSGKTVQKDTFYKAGTATADVYMFVDWFYMTGPGGWTGTWYSSGWYGDVYCPYGKATITKVAFQKSWKLMSSATCVTLVSGSCRPALGGKFCGYVPVDPCNNKCRADYYTIWVIGSDTIPALRGFMIKPWLQYPNGGWKCLKGVPSLSPANCSKCWDVPV